MKVFKFKQLTYVLKNMEFFCQNTCFTTFFNVLQKQSDYMLNMLREGKKITSFNPHP